MDPTEIYNKLGSIVNPITDHIKDWKSVNKNSILITMDFGEEFVFTYYNHHDWCLETKESYIRARLKECDCYI